MLRTPTSGSRRCSKQVNGEEARGHAAWRSTGIGGRSFVCFTITCAAAARRGSSRLSINLQAQPRRAAAPALPSLPALQASTPDPTRALFGMLTLSTGDCSSKRATQRTLRACTTPRLKVVGDKASAETAQLAPRLATSACRLAKLAGRSSQIPRFTSASSTGPPQASPRAHQHLGSSRSQLPPTGSREAGCGPRNNWPRMRPLPYARQWLDPTLHGPIEGLARRRG